MSKMLIIAEKPSVARDIAQALGGFAQVTGGWLERDDAIVSSAIGHLVGLHVPEAQSSGTSLETLPVIPAQFSLQVIERTKSQFNLLARLMKRSDVSQVVNACDAGREGELIFRLIYEAAGCIKPVRRMWLQSMTSDAIGTAFNTMKPGEDFNALADSAKCRSEADWLIGINGSRAITRLRERQTQSFVQMTAGRVQTPTLAIVVDRENEIKAFQPSDYWEVHATFSAQAGDYVGRWVGQGNAVDDSSARILNLDVAKTILAKCQGVHPSIVTDEEKLTSSVAPHLFDLTTLQREANKRFKFSAKKTLDIAQALYEKHKAITYPRTDAAALPEDYVGTAKQVMGAIAGIELYAGLAQRVLNSDWVRENKRIFDNSKISDHFAIIPSGALPSKLEPDETKVYDLIVRRFIAVFYPEAKYSLTTRMSVVAGETFKSTGKVLLDAGWRVVYGQQAEEDGVTALCAVDPNESVSSRQVTLKTLQTKPPARFTEATLLSAMEGAGKLVDDDDLRRVLSERGLGTPATRAATIEGLLADRDGRQRAKEPYLRREGKEQHLVPTTTGMALIEFLRLNGGAELTSPNMTGEWEQKLRLMEQGNYHRREFMREIADLTRQLIEAIQNKAKSIPVPQSQVLGVPCPSCRNQGVNANPRTFECASNCGWRFFREIAQKNLSDDEVMRLLVNGEVGPLEGFISKQRKPFSATLRMGADLKVEFVFEERKTPELGPALGAACPNCGDMVHVTTGSPPQLVCSSGDFRLWRVIAGRELSDAEARSLLTDGSLGAVHGFVSSRTKKTFSAGLKLSADHSKVEFVFEPR